MIRMKSDRATQYVLTQYDRVEAYRQHALPKQAIQCVSNAIGVHHMKNHIDLNRR